MNWYKLAKNEFDFSAEEKDIWTAMCRKEQDAVGIHFDLENNNAAGNIRRIKLETKIKSLEDIDSGELSVFAELRFAGGDWECPVGTFYAQIKEHSHWGPKFIYIPDKKAGNKNLVSSKKEGEWIVKDDDGNCEDLSERELWKSFKKHVEKRANEFYNKGHDVDKVEEYGMYDWSRSLGVV